MFSLHTRRERVAPTSSQTDWLHQYIYTRNFAHYARKFSSNGVTAQVLPLCVPPGFSLRSYIYACDCVYMCLNLYVCMCACLYDHYDLMYSQKWILLNYQPFMGMTWVWLTLKRACHSVPTGSFNDPWYFCLMPHNCVALHLCLPQIITLSKHFVIFFCNFK